MKNLSLLLGLGLAILVTPLFAEDAKPKKKAANRKQSARPIAAVQKQLAALELSDEQKKETDEILAKYSDKFAAAQDKAGQLTKEQRQAQKAASETAKADGKKGKQLRAEVDAALNLSDEQKKARAETQRATKEIQTSLKKELSGVLTPEQAAKLAPGGKQKKKKSV